MSTVAVQEQNYLRMYHVPSQTVTDYQRAEVCLCVPNPQGLDTVCSVEQMFYELEGVLDVPLF